MELGVFISDSTKCKIKPIYMSDQKSLTLATLQRIIKETLKSSLKPRYWVVAEINQLSIASAGHCYMELIERNEDSKQTVAKSSAVIWRSNVSAIFNRLSSSTGQELKSGIKVMFQVEVSFHEVYGTSLVVYDIDPTYTLGEAEVARRRTIKRLETEGLMPLNKELSLPIVTQRIAVISSATAAGYGDFMDEISTNEYGYDYDLRLFAATMQGAGSEESVVAALRSIYIQSDDFDCIVIIRGGGSVSDLSCFDSYHIAREISQSPIVVITGIGHDRDITIADMASGVSLKTPTAVARFLIDNIAEFDTLLSDQRSFVEDLFNGYCTTEREALVSKSHYLQSVVSDMVRERMVYFAQRSEMLRHGVGSFIAAHSRELKGQQTSIFENYTAQIFERQKYIISLHDILKNLCSVAFDSVRSKLELQQSNISKFDPAHIFALGYSLAKIEGKALRSTKQVEVGAEIDLKLLDGAVQATITKISD